MTKIEIEFSRFCRRCNQKLVIVHTDTKKYHAGYGLKQNEETKTTVILECPNKSRFFPFTHQKEKWVYGIDPYDYSNRYQWKQVS